jgi:GntR family L-lactate dehydrogenase operon transcriptional regulator
LLPLAPLARSDAGYWKDVAEIRFSLEGDAAYFAALRASESDKQRLQQAYFAVSTAPLDAWPRRPAPMPLFTWRHRPGLAQCGAAAGDVGPAAAAGDQHCRHLAAAVSPAGHRGPTGQAASPDPRRHSRRPRREARQHANAHLDFVQQRLLDIEEAPARARRAAAV